MKIPREIADRVVTGTMQELWDAFITVEGEVEDYEEAYDDVRFGMKVKFSIYDLWENNSNILRKDKDQKVIINSITYDLEDFRTEKEERRKIMVEIILDCVIDNELIKPRG